MRRDDSSKKKSGSQLRDTDRGYKQLSTRKLTKV